MSNRDIREPGELRLEYAGRAAEWARRSVYPMAIFLGGAPPVVGVAITVLYVLTEWDLLRLAGFLTTLAGIGCVLVAAGLLWIYWQHGFGLGQRGRESRFWRVAAAGVLLASNFPAALVCMSVAWDVQTKLHITVATDDDLMWIRNCALSTSRETKQIGPIGPGQSVRCSLKNPGEGTLSITWSNGPAINSMTVETHVDEDVHGDWTIRINGDSARVLR